MQLQMLLELTGTRMASLLPDLRIPMESPDQDNDSQALSLAARPLNTTC